MTTYNKDGSVRKKRCDAGKKRKDGVIFSVRMERDMRDYLKRVSRSGGDSVQQYIRDLIRKDMEDEDARRKFFAEISKERQVN